MSKSEIKVFQPTTVTLSAETCRLIHLWAEDFQRTAWELREWPPGNAALAAIHNLIERANV